MQGIDLRMTEVVDRATIEIDQPQIAMDHPIR